MQDNIILFNKDCLKAMKQMKDNQFDLAIVDPPYGISNKMKGSSAMGKQMEGKTWNDKIPSKEYFEAARKRLQQHQSQTRMF